MAAIAEDKDDALQIKLDYFIGNLLFSDKTGVDMSIFTDKYTRKFSAINFIVYTTLAIQAIIFLAPAIGREFIIWGGLFPQAVFHGQVWRIISYAFLHDPHGFFHIAFNMLGLWMFGKEIEFMWGSRKFFGFYFFSAIFAGLISLLSVLWGAANANIIGASGAIMALLVVYAYYFPERKLLFFFIFPMKVKTAVIVYAVISVMGTSSSFGGISHITHLGGIIAGFLWINIGDRFDLIVRKIGAFFQNSSNKSKKNDEYYNFEKPTYTNMRAEEVDKILDKINRSGIQSLTASERKILQEASADLSRK